MRRYKSAYGNTSSGTFKMLSSGEAMNCPSNATAAPPHTANTMAVCTARLTALSSRQPMAFAMTTFAPSAMPMKRLTMRPMIGPFAPTAATATVRASPVKLPTMATSEAWKSCSKIAVAATGRAKSGSLFQMEPCSMSISCFLTVVPMISLISFCFPLDRAPV